MEFSIFYAKLLGFYFLIAGISMLLNPREYQTTRTEALHNKSFSHLFGYLSLVFGLVIVLTHNVWVGWPIVITLIGYLSIIEGITRTCFTDRLEHYLIKFNKTKPYYLMSILTTVVGLGLLYLGYLH